MAAANITPKSFSTQYIMPQIVKFQKLTQSDWISLGDNKGYAPLSALVTPGGSVTNVLDTPVYGTLDINNGGTAYTATDTSIDVDAALPGRMLPYYLLTGSGEIMEVTAETNAAGAASTLTVRRGCLGTIASALGIANNNRCSVLNQFVFSNAVVGAVLIFAYPLSSDSRSRPFA